MFVRLISSPHESAVGECVWHHTLFLSFALRLQQQAFRKPASEPKLKDDTNCTVATPAGIAVTINSYVLEKSLQGLRITRLVDHTLTLETTRLG